ncbi:MAG TPA: hypothetical protein VGE01_05015 [Fimbriimonas sp.]
MSDQPRVWTEEELEAGFRELANLAPEEQSVVYAWEAQREAFCIGENMPREVFERLSAAIRRKKVAKGP